MPACDGVAAAAVEPDRQQHGDLVAWLERMPTIADPRGTLLYPAPELLSAHARQAYDAPKTL